MGKSMKTALSGRVRISVTGLFPERFLNLVAKRGLPVWEVRRTEEGGLILATTPAAFRRMRDPAFRAGMRVRILEKDGLPFVARRYRKRWGMALGMGLFLLIPLAFSRFLWDITLEGCEQLEPSRVLETLSELGLKRGTLLHRLDLDGLELQAALEIPELSFIAINLKGTTAQVQIRERVPVPQEQTPTELRDLVAAKDGQIERIEVYEGVAAVKRGDTVQKGDLLVSGAIPNAQVGVRYVSSDALVVARTWKTGVITAQRVATAQWPTGRRLLRYTLLVGDFSINFPRNGSISLSEYVTLYQEKPISLPGGIRLPVRLRTTAFCERVTVSRVQSDEELKRLCLDKLEEVTQTLEVEQVEQVDYDLTVEKDGARLTFEVTCLESITQPRSLALPEQEPAHGNVES
ncbi:MAG: sporulation protein YqfD [Clostridia bacterium]|nr:sporulation protein YqfD [Clostridia bacterium]